jgi:hypothetical protein
MKNSSGRSTVSGLVLTGLFPSDAPQAFDHYMYDEFAAKTRNEKFGRSRCKRNLHAWQTVATALESRTRCHFTDVSNDLTHHVSIAP